LSLEYGSRLDALLFKFDVLFSSTDKTPLYWFFASKVVTLSVLLLCVHKCFAKLSALCTRMCIREDGNDPNSLGIDLRNIQLHEEAKSIDDMKHAIADLVLCACHKMAFGTTPVSRRQAFDFLTSLYRVPEGAWAVAQLGHPNGLLEKVAEKILRG